MANALGPCEQRIIQLYYYVIKLLKTFFYLYGTVSKLLGVENQDFIFLTTKIGVQTLVVK